jgi:hypothetical protein
VVLNSKLPLEFFEARNALRIAQSEGADKYAGDSYQHAVQLMNNADGYATRKSVPRKQLIAVAREAVQTAEDARAIAVKRIEAERLANERQASANAQATSQWQADNANRQKEQAESDAANAQAAKARAESDAARARSDMADSQAASARALSAAQTDADQSRLAAQQAEDDKAAMRTRLVHSRSQLISLSPLPFFFCGQTPRLRLEVLPNFQTISGRIVSVGGPRHRHGYRVPIR